MQEHRVAVKKLLSSFSSESIKGYSTIESLQEKRMEDASHLFGSVGEDVNIEAPLFCMWGCNTLVIVFTLIASKFRIFLIQVNPKYLKSAIDILSAPKSMTVLQ
jgi:hypothetical protein